MHETMITVTGNLCADPELRFTQGGDAFAAFRIACTERKRNREGGWGDGHTNFVRVTAFRSLGQNCAATLKQGTRVIVRGRLRVTDWEQGERRGTNVEIDAHSVGPDLTFAFADVTKGVHSSGTDRMADPEVAAANDRGALPDGAEPSGLPEADGYGGHAGSGLEGELPEAIGVGAGVGAGVHVADVDDEEDYDVDADGVVTEREPSFA
ncbi:single-stranded DNA-binding protein [Arsenicicoccus bolidensis]|uniref:Single-stranded DNA-binding protein n=1 Tax=Arsenicicoccus bolidensis TaxID=229480 RepID=A0ABS9Q7B0_9MICO|nr:single-stranded DNA-binding protein [Arsenicicoccus bolidensis]MCG7323135.1 single-stranded DNA-binding protein [Arsenicicoccus bolidensis]